MSKLLEDEKVAKLVEREVNKAVKADRKRIIDGLKELKDEYADADAVVKPAKVIAAASKVVRDAA